MKYEYSGCELLSHEIRFFLTYGDLGMFVGVRKF